MIFFSSHLDSIVRSIILPHSIKSEIEVAIAKQRYNTYLCTIIDHVSQIKTLEGKIQAKLDSASANPPTLSSSAISTQESTVSPSLSDEASAVATIYYRGNENVKIPKINGSLCTVRELKQSMEILMSQTSYFVDFLTQPMF